MPQDILFGDDAEQATEIFEFFKFQANAERH
jgi:hypothetical protein